MIYESFGKGGFDDVARVAGVAGEWLNEICGMPAMQTWPTIIRGMASVSGAPQSGLRGGASMCRGMPEYP